jgi:hypothetical protein
LKARDRFGLGVLAVMWLLTAVQAQTVTETSALTLQQAVTIALEKNPLRKMALADTRVVSADVRQARSVAGRSKFVSECTCGHWPARRQKRVAQSICRLR